MAPAPKCSASGRAFPIPEGVDLSSGRQIVECPSCAKPVYVSRWSSGTARMTLTPHAPKENDG